MKEWLARINGGLGTGFTWAVGWALVGVLIQATNNLLPGLGLSSFVEAFDAPPEMLSLAIPGFLSGVFFSAVAGITERRLRFGELSLSRFAVWGGTGGLMLLLFAAVQIAPDLASQAPLEAGWWELPAVIVGVFAPLGAVSGAGYLALARNAEPWRSFLGQLLTSDQRDSGPSPTTQS